VTLFRYENVTSHPGFGGGHPQQVNLAIALDGRILFGGDIGKAGYGAVMIGNGETVDEVMAAYLTEHHFGWTLTQVPEPDLSQVCPLDADPACAVGGALLMARHAVMEAQRQPAHRQALLPPLIETDRGGRVRPENHHLVVAAEQLGYDWRSVAAVRIDGRTVPYRAWFADEEPDPGLPPRKLPPEPAPTVQTPSVVRTWVETRVEIGDLHVPGRLPDLVARRRIRESSGLTQADLAEMVGCTDSSIGMWERGEREPSGDLREKYAEVLHSLRKAGLGGDQPMVGTPASPAITEPQKAAQAVELSDDQRAQLANDVVTAVRSELPQVDADALLAAVIARINEAISSWEASSFDTADAAQPEDLFDADQLAELRKANGHGQVTVTKIPHPDRGGRILSG
jgi:transcriptional regulator with XRE-family HTH domain